MKTSARGIDGEEAVTERRYREAARFRAGSEIMSRDEGLERRVGPRPVGNGVLISINQSQSVGNY